MTTILIVDDNMQNRYLLESILTGYRYSVISAKNGLEALEVAKKRIPDMIITDILMPVMDGFELCRKWRADEQLSQIPLIFYTATYTDSRDEKFAMSLGADRFVVKPQTPDVLMQVVQEVLEEARKKPRPIPEQPPVNTVETLQQYNEVLFRKLEKKMHELEQEIAVRKRVEEELRASEKFLSNIVDHIPDMIFVKDARDLRFVRLNKAGVELLGYSVADLLGKNDYDFFPAPEADFFTGKDREVLRTNQLVEISEETIKTRNRGERILHTKKIPLADEGGRPAYLLGISEDITEKKRAEEQILLTNRKLALMTDVTYQDIQNKVTALRGYVELSADVTGDEERHAYIEKEQEVLVHIQQLIEKTKDYQQMGRDRSRWHLLDPAIRAEAAPLIRGRRIELKIALNGLALFTDPLIDRAFHNLIENAVIHGQTLTRIVFRYDDTPDGITLFCEDDGVGIPSGEKERIFQRVVGGKGRFGLFFTRELLSLSGMGIRETGEPGKGARFEITVPPGMYRFGENGNGDGAGEEGGDNAGTRG